MATLDSGLSIPSEIIFLVFKNLGPPDLFTASLVSHAWYRLAFPHLHQEIRIRDVSHLENLTYRLQKETPNDLMRIGLCLRSLLFECEDDASDSDSSNLDARSRHWCRFEELIPKLERLEYFNWSCDFLPPLSLFTMFQDSCPMLRMVSISSLDPDDVSEETNKLVFAFTNLTHLEVVWRPQNHGHPSRVPDAVIETIESSPDLVELSLNFSEIPTWRPTELFRNLSNPLSKLSQLRFGGELTVDWSELVSGSPRGFSLRTFFKDHPNLRGVHFDCDFQYQPGVAFGASTAEQLFPSLTSFTGSVTMCAAVISSTLARQLESLTVIHEAGGDSYSISALADLTKPLPRLKELQFPDYGSIDSGSEYRVLDINVLDKLLIRTPNLNTLALEYFRVELTHLFQPLMRVPCLSELTIRGEHDETMVDTVMTRLTEICPRLRRLRTMADDFQTDLLEIY